jgi:hypothetical protein
MLQLIIDIGRILIWEMAQLMLGCLLGMLGFKFLGNKLNKLPSGLGPDLLMIITASVCGVILPLDTYGLIPILITAVIIGVRYNLILPLFIANIIFNMLVPYTDVGFMWQTGIYRILLALLAGIGMGILLRQLKLDPSKILRIQWIQTFTDKTNFSFRYLKTLSAYINVFGPYMITGIILNTVFRRYIFYKLMNSINIGQIATTVFRHVPGYDITRPVFLLTMIIFNFLLDLKILSGLLSLFKWRGVAGYFVYNLSWILVLAVLNWFL